MGESDRGNAERANRILDAASRLIVHYGYDKTTVNDIAREAGVSKGAIYLHWKSKDELFDALIFREGEVLVEKMLERMEADPEAGSIFSLYQHAILALLNNRLMHALVTSDLRIVGDYVRRWKNTRMMSDANIFRVEMVSHLQQAGVIRADLDAGVVAYVLGLIRYGFLTVGQVIPPETAPLLDEVGKVLGNVLERGLAPEGGPNLEAGKQVMKQVLEEMRALLRRYQEEGLSG